MSPHSHLRAALLALLLVSAGLAGGVVYAGSLETQYVHATAHLNFLQKRQGIALQRAAFQQDDLLPVYGSSELSIRNPFRSDIIFLLYPTGFTPFLVAGDGNTPIIQAQTMAGIGNGLRGKRVVVSLSPQFFLQKNVTLTEYLANFSRLHAYQFVLSDLPMSIKQPVAGRMLQYPRSFGKDDMLRSLLHAIAEDGPLGRITYAILYPIAKLQELVFELQDHWEAVRSIQDRPELKSTVQHITKPMNWNMLAAHALPYAQAHADNNKFAIDNTLWDQLWRGLIANDRTKVSDEEFTRQLNESSSFEDLRLMVQTVKAYGGEPLVLSPPFHKVYWNWKGVSTAALHVYADKLRALGKEEGVAVVVLDRYENDKYLMTDPGSHLSAEGWVYYSQAMDDFFQGKLDVVKQ